MNKKSREKDKQDPLSKTCAFVDNGTLSSVCWDQACGTLIDLSHLRGRVFDGKTQSRRSSSTHVNVLDYFSRLLLIRLLYYLVRYNVKLHVIVFTPAVRSLPSSSATWLAEASRFSSHACSTARAHRERSQNGKEERKL